jgi:hypothetical protein
VKLFSVIDVDCSDSTYCFGVIGNGSAFCVRKRCTVKTHSTVKMSFAGRNESFVFIRRNVHGSAFSEPKLAASKVPADVMSEWESQNLSVTDWSTEFQAIDGTSELLTSAQEIQNESDFLVESQLLRTPGKRKKDSLSGEEFEGPLPSWPNPKYHRTLPEDPQELEELVNEGVRKGVLSNAVCKIETHIVGMSFALEDTAALHHDQLVTLEDNLEVMIGVIQTLKSRVGSSVDIGDRYLAPTLWGSTAFIADDLTRLSDELTSMSQNIISPMKETLEVLSATDVLVYASKMEKVVQTVKILLSRVESINESLKEVKTDLVLVRTEQGMRFLTPGIPPQDSTDELMDFIIADKTATRVFFGPEVSVVSPSKSQQHSREDLKEEDTDVMPILNKLIDDVKSLQAGKHNSAIKFGGLGISDLADCQAWCDKHFDGYQYGLIMDPLLMLDRMQGEDEVWSTILKDMDLQDKMNIRSGAETSALNAMRYSRPRLFHTGRPSVLTTQNKSRLSQIPTHAAWNPGGHGVMDQTREKMNVLELCIADDISNTFDVESTAHWIASKCLTASVSFLNQELFACVESIYKRLFNFSKFTTEQAWSLTTQVQDRILADLYMPKDNVVHSLVTKNTRVTCAQVMLAAFKTHDIMGVYVAHKFENHPSVSTEYVKFLATNSGSDKVVKMGETLESVKEDAKAAGKKADIASSKCSDLVKEVNALIAKVKALEKK